MTVKTQNGKVITKLVGNERRVSCSCCDPEPTTCCMYSNVAYFDGLIVFDDLPASISIGGVTYTKGLYSYSDGGLLQLLIPSISNNWEFTYGGSFLGLAYECIPFGETISFIDPVSGDPFDYGVCEDQFEDTYKIIFSPTTPESNVFGLEFILQRESLCLWEYRDEWGGISLVYDDRNETESSFPYKWLVYGEWNNFDEGIGVTPIGPKDGDMNTPEGYYKDISFELATVGIDWIIEKT